MKCALPISIELSDELRAGRVMSKRASGGKLMFYDLHADGLKIQVIAQSNYASVSEEDFAKTHASVKRGDIVGINGFPGKPNVHYKHSAMLIIRAPEAICKMIIWDFGQERARKEN